MMLVGVGLIGGSLALALRRAGWVQEVVGVARAGRVLDEAMARGVIDWAATDLARAAREADLIVLATPVGVMPDLLATLAPALAPDSVLTDVGSVKAQVVAAGQVLGVRRSRFCPGHPIAGAEIAGVAGARWRSVSPGAQGSGAELA